MVTKQHIDNKKIYLIGLVSIFLVLGFIFGVLYQAQKNFSQIEKTKSIFKILNSQVVPSIVSYGIVTDINNREVTIVFNEDPVTIKIKDDASVNIIGKNDERYLDKLDINQIKVGDALNAEVNINSDGVFESDSVIIFSN